MVSNGNLANVTVIKEASGRVWSVFLEVSVSYIMKFSCGHFEHNQVLYSFNVFKLKCILARYLLVVVSEPWILEKSAFPFVFLF